MPGVPWIGNTKASRRHCNAHVGAEVPRRRGILGQSAQILELDTWSASQIESLKPQLTLTPRLVAAIVIMRRVGS